MKMTYTEIKRLGNHYGSIIIDIDEDKGKYYVGMEQHGTGDIEMEECEKELYDALLAFELSLTPQE